MKIIYLNVVIINLFRIMWKLSELEVKDDLFNYYGLLVKIMYNVII